MSKNLPTINGPDMLSTADIAKMLDVTPKTVATHYTKRPDFPRPVINISQKLRRWHRADVIHWMTGGAKRQAYSRAAIDSALSR